MAEKSPDFVNFLRNQGAPEKFIDVFRSTKALTDKDKEGLMKIWSGPKKPKVGLYELLRKHKQARETPLSKHRSAFTIIGGNLLHFNQKASTLVFDDLSPFTAMVEVFQDPEILTKTLNIVFIPTDNLVQNSRGPGMVREVYSRFWAEFYDHCTAGRTLKVPFLRHDMSADMWRAIGRILLKGFYDCGYLPIKLAQPFLEKMLFGEVHSDLTASFLQFLTNQEQDVLKRALNDFATVDDDELLQVLDKYECRRKFTARNLPRILEEISHKELVQKPMFVIDCWRNVMKTKIPLSSCDLTKMYNDLKPTPYNVVGILRLPSSMTSTEAEVAQHLWRYVLEMNEEKLGIFLKFCTGSDLLVCSAIQVGFRVQTSFSRRPMANTCLVLLLLSDSYENFAEFCMEFDSVLQSSAWD